MYSPILSFGTCTPGVSINTICAVSSVIIPFILNLVVCGLGVVIATLKPTILFTNVDLPAFGLPTTVIYPDLNIIYSSTPILYQKMNYFTMKSMF